MQVYNFVKQLPDWDPNYVYRPVFDVTVDDAIALALMDKKHRQKLLLSGTKLSALLTELNEWTANRYNFVKTSNPRLLNYLLKIHPYPFYDYVGKSRTELCELSLLDLTEAVVKDFDNIEPVLRTYPDELKYDILHENDRSVLIRSKTDRYGADDLIAQQLFEFRPNVVRVIIARKIKNTTKHFITICNSNIYNSDLNVYNYVDTKELNIGEKKVSGEPEWKNLKVTALGPRKGTALALDIVWQHAQIK